jgi:hypothetical protein
MIINENAMIQQIRCTCLAFRFGILGVLITIVLIGFSSPVLAQAANGCGSGWNRPFVPDRIRPLACDFKQACDRHDVCYGACEDSKNAKIPQCEYLRCEKGGDLVGQSACQSVFFDNLREAARTRKEICDKAFALDLVDLNPNRPQCSFFSWLYPNAVRLFGKSSFVGIDPASSSTLSQEEQEKSLDAIDALFKEWSAAQIKTFEEQVRNGAIKLDFDRPLRFDQHRGLFNP